MRKILSAVALCLLAGPALAENSYVGVGLGQSKVDIDTGSIPAGIDVTYNDTDTSWKAFAGIQLNENFAAEFSYADFGTFKMTASSGGLVAEQAWDANAFAISMVGILPVNPAFSVFAKVGLAHWSVDTNLTSNFGAYDSASDSGDDPVYGVGAQLNIQNMMLRAEFERYSSVGNNDTTGESDVDIIGVSAAVHF